MKFFKILIVVFMMLSFLPLDGFCADHHDTNDQHHCVLVCNASCHSAIVPVFPTVVYPVIVSVFLFSYRFSYQDPILDTFKRPPVVFIS